MTRSVNYKLFFIKVLYTKIVIKVQISGKPVKTINNIKRLCQQSLLIFIKSKKKILLIFTNLKEER